MNSSLNLAGPVDGRSRLRREVPIMLLAVVALVAAACGPPPPPPTSPNWVTTQLPRVATDTDSTNYFGAWTNDEWFATLRASTSSGSPPSAVLQFHPRSGPGNSSLGTPQELTPSVDPSFGGPIGDELVGLVGSSAVEFFDEANGVWSAVGTFDYPGQQQLKAMSDDWLVLSDILSNPGGGSQTYAYPIDRTPDPGGGPPLVVVGAPQVLEPDPAWPAGLRNGFGIEVAIDGDLMAVRANDPSAGSPPGVLVLRKTAGTWNPAFSIGGAPGGPVLLGQSLDVHDGDTLDRIAVQAMDDGSPARVDVYADAGAGFALEQSILRDTSETDTTNGLYFGSEVALDGSLLALAGRTFDVASADPTHGPVNVSTVQVFRHDGTWDREEELRLSTDPAPPGIQSSSALALQAAGNHVAATVWISPDPPPGCQFPCFYIGSEAWSLDRTN